MRFIFLIAMLGLSVSVKAELLVEYRVADHDLSSFNQQSVRVRLCSGCPFQNLTADENIHWQIKGINYERSKLIEEKLKYRLSDHALLIGKHSRKVYLVSLGGLAPIDDEE